MIWVVAALMMMMIFSLLPCLRQLAENKDIK